MSQHTIIETETETKITVQSLVKNAREIIRSGKRIVCLDFKELNATNYLEYRKSFAILTLYLDGKTLLSKVLY